MQLIPMIADAARQVMILRDMIDLLSKVDQL
jgi:hypothetical protein